MLKLHQRGLVQLPPRRFAPTNRMRRQRVEVMAWEQTPIHGSLDCLSPLQVREVNLDGEERALFAGALCAFHYLGHGGTVGENLRYVWCAMPGIDPWLFCCSVRLPGSVRTGIGSSDFLGHPGAGWRSAVIYSLLQSCRRRGIEIQACLTDVLTRRPGMKHTAIDQFLPENWKPPRRQPA